MKNKKLLTALYIILMFLPLIGQRQRVSHKLKLCPEEYLPIIEGAIDGALKMEQTAKQKEDA